MSHYRDAKWVQVGEHHWHVDYLRLFSQLENKFTNPQHMESIYKSFYFIFMGEICWLRSTSDQEEVVNYVTSESGNKKTSQIYPFSMKGCFRYYAT